MPRELHYIDRQDHEPIDDARHFHICARCGRMFNGTAILCEACRKAQETEEEQTARRKVAAFRRLYTG